MSDNQKTKVTLPFDTEIMITRTFAGPRELVFDMWTKAEHLREWWGPEGWSLPVCEIDFRPGGSWIYCMSGPEEMTSCGKGVYQEIEEPVRIVYDDFFTDGDGNPMEGMPVAHIILDFVEEGGQTIVYNTVRYPTQADRDMVIEMGMEAGIGQTFDRLDGYLAQIQAA